MRGTLIWVGLIFAVSGCSKGPINTTLTQSSVDIAPTQTLTPTVTSSPKPTSTLTPTPTPGPALEELMGTPNALAAAANLDAASVQFKSLTDLYTHRAEPWMGLAGLALRQGDTASALEYLKQAVEAEPTNLDAYRQLALLQEQLGLYVDAARTYGTLLDQHPNDPDVLVARATANARLGLAEDAIRDVQAAQEIDPYRQYAWLNIAAAAAGGRFYEAAAQIANAGLQAHPDTVSLQVERGLALLALDRQKDALDAFSAAIQLDPTNSRAYHWRGRVRAGMGQSDSAISDFKRAGELGIQEGIEGTSEGYEAMADAADLLAQSGKVDEAFTYLAQQVIHFGSQDALLMGYARIDYSRGNIQSALSRLAPLVRDAFVPAFYWRGMINQAAGNREDAISDLISYLQVRRSGPDVEAARRTLSDLGVDPDSIIAPTPTPTPLVNPSEDDGGD